MTRESPRTNADILRNLPEGSLVEVRDAQRKDPDLPWVWMIGNIVKQLGNVGFKPHSCTVRIHGKPRFGSKYPLRTYWYSDESSMARIRVLHTPTPGERLQANIYNDWLEEHGFPEAGKALRDAFPLIERIG